MGKQIILRPINNRPEMLTLSIRAEIEAREYFDMGEDFTTIFLVEPNPTTDALNVIKSYPFKYECIFREKQCGSTINILEGYRYAFDNVNDFVILLEEDILVHKTYFQYMHCLLNHKDIDKFSILSAYTPENDTGDVHEVYFHQHYSSLAPLLSKDYFDQYVIQHCTNDYYYNCARYIVELNNKYKHLQEQGLYKYKDATHHAQDGLQNRLVDVAWAEEKRPVVFPKVNRQIHIGFHGENRAGALPGKDYNERLSNLKDIVKSPETMYAHTKSKQYDDYKVFAEEKLSSWDGTLFVKRQGDLND